MSRKYEIMDKKHNYKEMKKDIHPKYHSDAKILCACGAVLETGSTQQKMEVEICASCHPFYTGKQKVVDTTGRVDRFKKLAEKSAKKKSDAKKAKEKKTVAKKVVTKKTIAKKVAIKKTEKKK